MPVQSLSQVLILLLASVLVLAVARRIGMPAILGYLVVGIALGPFALLSLPHPETRSAPAATTPSKPPNRLTFNSLPYVDD